MKDNPSRIPHPSSERKVSPIIGRGARPTRVARKKRRLVDEDYYEISEDDHERGLHDGLLEESPRKRTPTRKGDSAKVEITDLPVTPKMAESEPQFRLSITAEVSTITPKAAESEPAPSTLQPAATELIAAQTANDDGNASQSSNSLRSDSVQPPPKVAPGQISKRNSSANHDPALEEPVSSSEIVEEPSEKIVYANQRGMAVGYFQKIRAKRPRILAAAAVFLLLSIGFLSGRLQTGTSPSEEDRAAAKAGPQLVKELNEALALIESGESSTAFQKIQALSEKHPDVSSLDYLAALAAMQAGDLKSAQEKATLSITKNQKISDSLVLLSMTESSAAAGEKSSLRDPKIVRENLLRDAVNEDVANPFPMIELASFLRSQKRDDEALDLLHAANARLHPIDTHVVVQTSIALMKLQQLPDEELPAARAEGSIAEIFSSVYISLRRKDYNQAAIALEKGRHQASPDLFTYLINDPVFKPFRTEPVMTNVL